MSNEFSPSISITVPDVDDDGNNVNDFSGTVIAVAFEPVTGSDAGCTAAVSVNYMVEDNGDVSGSAPDLVDRPTGVTTQCSYDFETTEMNSDLAPSSGTTGTVSVGSASVVAVYLTPLPPTGLMTSAATAGELVVSWTAPAPAPTGGYQVQYRVAGETNWSPADPGQDVAAGTTTHTFTGLTAGMYHARVRADYGDDDDVSPWEDTTSPVQVVLPAPTGVTAASDAAGELAVSWTAPASAPADGYHVQYRLGSGTWMPPDPGRVVAAGTTMHTFTGLAAGMYHARVRSRDASSPGNSSAWVDTTSGDPVEVKVRTVSIDSEIRVERNAFVTLGCLAPDDCNLEVQFDGMQEDPATPGLQFTLTDAPDHGRVSNGRGAAPLSVGETILWSLVRGGDAGGTWTYNHYAEAINALSSVPPSGADEDALTDSFQFLFEGTIYTVNLVINQPPEVVASPSEPGPFTAGTEATFDVANDFTDPNGDVLMYEPGTLAGPMTGAVDISGSTVTIDTTATAGTYTIPVMAMESAEDGGLSVTHTYTVVVSESPPTDVTATADAGGELAVSWTAPSTAPSGGYHVQYSNDGGANWLPAAPGQVVAMDTTSHTFTGLAAGTYSTRVRAFSSGGFTSAWVQGTAVQVDVYEFIADVRVERGGSVRLAGSIDVWLRGRPVSTAIAIALGEITLRREPAYGSLNAEGHHTRANEIFSSNLGRLRIGADGDSYNHRSDGVDFDVSSDADPDDPMDSFDIEIAGVLYTVPITIFNRAPRIVDTPSAGPFMAGTEAPFDVSGDFTDSRRDRGALTYALERDMVTGPVPTAVTFMDSTVTIGTTGYGGHIQHPGHRV